ncbi:MAG TPA: efflux RND transporter periplasmic adaptor subunit [Steroidobacteraceae bacterium]|jgi:membrane fusion protein (multidrug efflux system)|nr:efflux RND transporter periplasmic adaptor subunit [Steroidobacteraceae bacterium]
MTDQGDEEDEEDPEKAAHDKKRNYIVIAVFGAVLVLIAIGVLIYHLAIGRYYVATTDAYVNGDLVRLAPQISGTVAEITTDETQAVRRGQLLVRLDSHDTDNSLAQAKANLAQTVREVVQLFAQEIRDKATIAAQAAQLKLADQNLSRDRGLISAHGVAQQDLERDQEGTRSAEAGLRQARAQFVATHAAVADTDPQNHPRVMQAEASLRSAWLASNRTRILAPISGYVVRRSVQLGQQVTPASEMLAIVPLESVWIDANVKETQLQKIRIGQPVRVTADVYGSGFKYHGIVLGLDAGTGAALAVLPAENATGNWIKIVQRLPVRIGLDPSELKVHPLFLGLSTNIEIDVHDLSGASLSLRPTWPADVKTDVYAAQDAGVDAELQRIVTENLKGVSIAQIPALARAAP